MSVIGCLVLRKLFVFKLNLKHYFLFINLFYIGLGIVVIIGINHIEDILNVLIYVSEDRFSLFRGYSSLTVLIILSQVSSERIRDQLKNR